MPGWLTNGVTAVTPATYTAAQFGATTLPGDTNAANGVNPQDTSLPLTIAGMSGNWATLTAAGASQGTATAMTTFKNLVNVALTASTKGVKLPTAVTGLTIVVGNGATFGVKVYPSAAGQTIGAATTATTADTVLAINKVNIYYAISATKWIVFRGS